MSDQRRWGTGRGQRSPARGCRETLFLAQTWRTATNSPTSFSMAGHQNRCLMTRHVLLTAGWQTSLLIFPIAHIVVPLSRRKILDRKAQGWSFPLTKAGSTWMVLPKTTKSKNDSETWNKERVVEETLQHLVHKLDVHLLIRRENNTEIFLKQRQGGQRTSPKNVI